MADSWGIIRALWAAISDCFQQNAQPLTMGQARAWIAEHYAKENFDSNTVYQQIRGSCANLESAFKHRKATPKILIYNDSTRTYRLANADEIVPLEANATAAEAEDEGRSESIEQNSTFALESHLRDFLARDLSRIEEGLELWSHDPPTVEFPIERRRIDLLARDRNQIPVVIELKLNSAYDRVVGQGLLYRALVRKLLKVEKVRLILVGSEISEELKLASQEIADIELFEYKLSFTLNKVAQR